MTNVLAAARFPSWKEYFINHSKADALNLKPAPIFQAAFVSPLATDTRRSELAQELDICCALAASTMPGHIWFAHHFHRLGNLMLDDHQTLKFVALEGLDSHAGVRIINIAQTFQGHEILCPAGDRLRAMRSPADLDAAIPNAPNPQNELTAVELTGVMFLPPFLCSDLATANAFDAATLFFAALQSINSWVGTFDDDTHDAIYARQAEGTLLLQWLWATHHSLIPGSPIQPTRLPDALAWQSDLHHRYIHSPTAHPGGEPNLDPNLDPAPAPAHPAQLSLSIAKIATLFEAHTTEEARRSELKEPSWGRINSPTKLTILRAMSTNGMEPATTPTTEFNEFCTQRSAAAAHQSLIHFFELHDRARFAAPSTTLSTALWSGSIRAPTPGSPDNLSVFFVPKVASTQKVNIPTTHRDLLHQISNFQLVLRFIFGESSIIHLRFASITQHITRYELEYEDIISQQPLFPATLLSLIDRRIQLFLESCSTSLAMSAIDYSLLGFDQTLRDILDGSFHSALPSPMLLLIAKSPQHPTKPPNPVQDAAGKRKLQLANPPPNKVLRGDPVVNSNIHPAWRLKPNEDYAGTFVRGIDRSSLPKTDVCLNYHIRGSCHTLCQRATTHIPAMSLTQQQRDSATAFITKVREKADP